MFTRRERVNKAMVVFDGVSPACQIENPKMWPVIFSTRRQHRYAKVKSAKVKSYRKCSADHALATVVLFEIAANKCDH